LRPPGRQGNARPRCSGVRPLRRGRFGGGSRTTSTFTRAVPPSIFNLRAAAPERSITRPLLYGPRSLIRTVMGPATRLPSWSMRVTRTRVPKGRVRWAAVIAWCRYGSPEAVRRPEKRAA
jgi:hypothetical protein